MFTDTVGHDWSIHLHSFGRERLCVKLYGQKHAALRCDVQLQLLSCTSWVFEWLSASEVGSGQVTPMTGTVPTLSRTTPNTMGIQFR